MHRTMCFCWSIPPTLVEIFYSTLGIVWQRPQFPCIWPHFPFLPWLDLEVIKGNDDMCSISEIYRVRCYLLKRIYVILCTIKATSSRKQEAHRLNESCLWQSINSGSGGRSIKYKSTEHLVTSPSIISAPIFLSSSIISSKFSTTLQIITYHSPNCICIIEELDYPGLLKVADCATAKTLHSKED
jgi:hypothetical protein